MAHLRLKMACPSAGHVVHKLARGDFDVWRNCFFIEIQGPTKSEPPIMRRAGAQELDGAEEIVFSCHGSSIFEKSFHQRVGQWLSL